MIFDTSEVAPLNRKTTVIPQDQVEAQLALCSQVQAYWHGQGRTPTAYVETYGCQQNEADSQRIRGLLAACGYGFGQGPEGADLVVMNTCAIREHAEQRVFGNLGALTHTKRRHPAQKIFLCGCMAGQPEVEERLRKSFPHVDGVFSTHHLWQFPEILLRVLTTGKRVYYTQDEPGSIAEGLPVRREGHLKAWVSIMYGCNNFCSYCIVPYVRGRERSRRPEAILAECRELIESGYKDITLLGQNVNSYGKDLDCGVDFSDLLAEIAGLPGDFLVRLHDQPPQGRRPPSSSTPWPGSLKVAKPPSPARAVRQRPGAEGHEPALQPAAVFGAGGLCPEGDAGVGPNLRCDRGLSGRDGGGVRGDRDADRARCAMTPSLPLSIPPGPGTPAASLPDPATRQEKSQWFRPAAAPLQNAISEEKHRPLM